MACYCARITRNVNDISSISSAMEKIKTLEKIVCDQETRLSELCESMMKMATPDNIGACVAGISAMNRGLPSLIDTMVSNCETRISTLNNDTGIFKSEDRAHHIGLKRSQQGSGGNA